MSGGGVAGGIRSECPGLVGGGYPLSRIFGDVKNSRVLVDGGGGAGEGMTEPLRLRLGRRANSSLVVAKKSYPRMSSPSQPVLNSLVFNSPSHSCASLSSQADLYSSSYTYPPASASASSSSALRKNMNNNVLVAKATNPLHNILPSGSIELGHRTRYPPSVPKRPVPPSFA